MSRIARNVLLLSLATLGGPGTGYTQGGRRLPEHDRVRLAEAFRLAEAVRPAVWPGWERTPMPVLLVTDSTEFLIGHPEPSPEFSSLGRDPLLEREVHSRPRRFPATLLATFPAVAGRSTIVVGSAASTGKSSGEWVLTLLHEHFHQWQSSLPGYYARAAGLGLARGDTTGQWMLDYPFPYDSAPVQRAVSELAASLADALRAPADAGTDTSRAPAADRARLRRLLSPEDHRYLEFQLWQEGVPRFVELAAAEAAGRSGPPAAAFRDLPDYVPYAELAARMRLGMEAELEAMSLARERRTGFYTLGAGLALLLQRTRPDWKDHYARRPFELAELQGPAR
jgi:hypothetical protein